MMDKIIEVDHLSFVYPNGKTVLNDVSFSFEKEQIWGIIGASGCGKSTLCLCLSGIIPHSMKGKMKGDVCIAGSNTRNTSLAQLVPKVGIVFQDPDTQLFCPTVEDEVAFGPENLCVPPQEIRARVDKVLSIVGLQSERYKNPNQLSGGQKQLVALASVLSLNPEILIFDEIMPRLDTAARKRIEALIMKLKAEGKTIIMVEHDLGQFLQVIDGGIILEKGQIVYQGKDREILAEKAVKKAIFNLDKGRHDL